MKLKLNTAMLEKAIAEGRLVFHYQPVISLFTGKICGAESLIRWKQPDGSLVLPDVFIPFTEKTGFINQMTRVMLPKFVQDLADLNALDPSLFLSLNVSPKIFNDDSFLKVLRRTTSGKLARPENFYPVDSTGKCNR